MTAPQREGRPIEILLVEDNPGDVVLIQETMKGVKLNNNLRVVGNGEEALALLRREGKYGRVPRTDLILLDLRLPGMDGCQVLDKIKNDDRLKFIPVVILTASEAEEDILRAYKLKANCYISKPVDMEQFMKVIRSIEQFWLTVVKLPTE